MAFDARIEFDSAAEPGIPQAKVTWLENRIDIQKFLIFRFIIEGV